MLPTSVTSVFCEDIREEKDGRMTLIGILNDNANVGDPTNPIPGAPLIFKLCLYVRIHFDPDFKLKSSSVRLVMPDNSVRELGAVDLPTVEQTKKKAKESGNAIAGVTLRVIMNGFQLPRMGQIKVEVQLDDTTYVAGILNCKPAESTAPTSSTAH